MLGNGGVYAAKKRKKPVQKMPKAPALDGGGAVKSTPSKRHRDRLNGELDRLTALLPFSPEVRGRLDKLSVLRLSVGYVKVKSYFHGTLQKRACPASSLSGTSRNGHSASTDQLGFSEGDLLLQALDGFVLVVTSDGSIFYTSPTIQDYLGFHESDVLHQSVFELIHTDDRPLFRGQLHFALDPGQAEVGGASEGEVSPAARSHAQAVNYPPRLLPPENSSFLERTFCCRFRCLLDNSSGFLALNVQGRLKYLDVPGAPVPPQLALFAIATPLHPPSVMEIRTKTLIFQTKHRLDFRPMGIDTRGKLVLGYSETELVTKGSGYQFIHAADMMYCADNHLRMMKTGDSGFSVFRLLTQTSVWVWVQASARLVFKDGRPDFIIARQRALTNEEGEEHLRQRRIQLPFNFATGEALLYDSAPSLDPSSAPLDPSAPPGGPAPPGPAERPLDPASLLGSLLRQDQSVYAHPPEPTAGPPPLNQEDPPLTPDPLLSLERAFLDSHALLSVPGVGGGRGSGRPRQEDATARAMLDSLEQILGGMADGGGGGGALEGLEVGEGELRGWESALFRFNVEMEAESGALSDALANDVFSYVEEALRKETNGSGHFNAFDPIDGLSAARLPSNESAAGAWFPFHNLPSTESEHSQSSVSPGNQVGYGSYSSGSETQWQVMRTDMNSDLGGGFGEQGFLGNGVPGHLSCSPGDAAMQGQWSSPGRGSGFPHGNQMVPPPLSHNGNQPHPGPLGQTWTPSIPNTNHNQNHNHNHNPQPSLPATADQSLQQSLVLNRSGCGQILGQPYLPQPWQQTSWLPQQQQQQLPPQGFLTGVAFGGHSDCTTPPQAPPTLSPPDPRLLTPSSDSCMFGGRRGLTPAPSPLRSNGAPPSSSSVHAVHPLWPRPSPAAALPVWPGAARQLTGPLTTGPRMAPSAGASSLAHEEGARCSLPGFPPGNGSVQAPYFYLSADIQIPNASSHDDLDPSSFP